MKKSNFIKAMSAALALTVGVTCFTGCGKEDTTIDIGASGPLTGGAAIYGIAVKNSAQMAVDEINAAGGLDGVKFSFSMYDDQHNQTLVQAGYNDLYEKGMQVSLGCVTTKPCLQFKELSNQDNVFFMTPSATSDAVPEYANAYQMCFCDSSQGAASATYVKNTLQKTEKIGVFYKNDDDYSNGIYQSFKTAMDNGVTDSWGGYDVTVQSFDDDHATDFTTQVTALKDCTFIFMPIYYGPASTFMKQAKTTVAADAVYFGGDGLDGIDGEDGLGSDFTTIPQEISYISHYNANATSGKAKDYKDAYVAKYGINPIQFGAAAYDCVYAIYEAMKVAKQNGVTIDAKTSASDICNALKTVFQSATFSFSGTTGTGIKWLSDGKVDATTKDCVSYVIKEKNSAK